MENLQPLDVCTEGIGAAWTRQGLAVGGLWSLVMAAGTPWLVPEGTGIGWMVGTALIVVLIGGPAFGWLWARAMERAMRRLTEKVFHGIEPFAVTCPSATCRYRLPASLRISDAMAVGGVLFLGSGEVFFVPHRRNLPSHREPTRIPVDPGFHVDLVAQTMTPGRRALYGTLPALLRISSGGQAWLFVVPRPEDTAAKLRRAVAA